MASSFYVYECYLVSVPLRFRLATVRWCGSLPLVPESSYLCFWFLTLSNGFSSVTSSFLWSFLKLSFRFPNLAHASVLPRKDCW